jgi:hypothetical protein
VAPDSDDVDAPASHKGVVLILGDFVHEGVTAKITTLGYVLSAKSLRSGPKHWQRIASAMKDLNDDRQLAAVFAYVPTPTLLAISDPKYAEALAALVAQMERTSTIVFLYEDNLQGVIEPPPWYYEGEEEDQRRQSVRDYIKELGLDHVEDVEELVASRMNRGLPTRQQWLTENSDLVGRAQKLVRDDLGAHVELAPFRQRSEVTIRIFEALDDIAGGTFLRVYVPRGRYQEEQLKQVLELLGRYFREIEGREFSIDTHDTRRGTTYVFRDRSGAGTVQSLQVGLQRFDQFMADAQINPASAEDFLRRQGASKADAETVVAKYARVYRRLILDARHELEQRKLTLSHQMEAEVLDAREVASLVGIDEKHPSSLFSIVGNTGSVTINLPSTSIELGPGAKAFIDRLDAGVIVHTPQDKELLRLIQSLNDNIEAMRLRSDLERLSDDAISRDDKSTSVQRLKAFLYRSAKSAGEKVTDAAVQSLIVYLEGKLTGKVP